MMAGIIMEVLGVLFCILGFLIWKKEKISLLHSYHYDKVTVTDKKAFCTLSGMGVCVIGVGLLASGVMMIFVETGWAFIPFGIGFLAGFSLLIMAGVKYNR